MTRDEKIAEARRMRSEGTVLRVIGDRFGVSPQTIMRWTDDEDKTRRENALRAPAKRAWENEHDRRPCLCGALKGVGTHRYGPLCRGCADEVRTVGRAMRMQPIYDLWHAGLSLRAIGDALGLSANTVKYHVCTMRTEGWDMPYRHNGYGAIAA